MVIKSFSVRLRPTDTQDTIIKFEDDIEFGSLKAVLEASVDLSGIAQGKVTLKPQEYPMALAMAAIVEPQDLKGNITNFTKLGGKTAMKIMKEICKAYSLAGFLADIALMMGEEEMASMVEKIKEKVHD